MYRDIRTSRGLPTITIPSNAPFASYSEQSPVNDSPVITPSPSTSAIPRRTHRQADSIDSTTSSNSSSPKARHRKFQMPLEPPTMPAAMQRSGSESPMRGLPGARRPSFARQASIAVMETASDAPAVPASRPSIPRTNTGLVTTGGIVAGTRNRSMSRGEMLDDRSAFSASPYPLPPPTPTSALSASGRFGSMSPYPPGTGGGLKDVLKMAPMPAAGQNDLLPPSPSVHSSTANRFNFLPLPSPLSHTHSHSNLQAAAAAASSPHATPMGASPSSYGSASHMHFNRPPSPPSSTLNHLNQQHQQHRRQVSQDLLDGFPPSRPLDYSRLTTAADVHLELERTATDLGRWLDLIDVGLGNLLYDVPAEMGGGRPPSRGGGMGE